MNEKNKTMTIDLDKILLIEVEAPKNHPECFPMNCPVHHHEECGATNELCQDPCPLDNEITIVIRKKK